MILLRYRRLPYSAVSMRMTRSTVLEVLREDYVRTARAKGSREHRGDAARAPKRAPAGHHGRQLEFGSSSAGSS